MPRRPSSGGNRAVRPEDGAASGLLFKIARARIVPLSERTAYPIAGAMMAYCAKSDSSIDR